MAMLVRRSLVTIASLIVCGASAPALRAQSAGVEEVVVTADAPAAAEEAAANPDAPAASFTDGKARDPELEAIRREREKIAAKNALAAEKLRQDLFTLEAEKKRLQLENSLRAERLNAEMADLKSQLEKIALQTEAITKTAALEAAQRRWKLDRELASLRADEERTRLKNSIASAELESRLGQMRLEEAEHKVHRAELDMEVAQLQTELTRREKSEVLRDLVNGEMEYTKTPFKDGVLRISDRRIELNGVIVQSVADHVVERIDYFNNKSTEYPIFLVIDYSPGGSVMSGYKILKAMEGSQAPVYVVVKSFVASMAAVITTLAEESFAYPNAIILHHQIAWLGSGNLTQQREQLEEAEQWWRRLAEPVARKMGLTLDQMIAKMYEKNSDGNWREFADRAVELKWVDHIVNTIWETSMDKNPDRFGSMPVVTLQLDEKKDEQGNAYTILPRLPPFDYYFLYNPDHYFRLR